MMLRRLNHLRHMPAREMIQRARMRTWAKRLAAMDTARSTSSGALFLSGWVDDSAQPTNSLAIETAGTSQKFEASQLLRHDRSDIDVHLGKSHPLGFGFWLFK